MDYDLVCEPSSFFVRREYVGELRIEKRILPREIWMHKMIIWWNRVVLERLLIDTVLMLYVGMLEAGLR